MQVRVLGSMNLDQFCRVPAFPRPGETVLAHDMSVFAGGKGLNQAIASARMGAVTTMLGAVGDDTAGRLLMAMLHESGVATDDILVRAGTCSGQAHITVTPSGENQIVVIGGANATIIGRDIDHRQSPAVRLAQLETPIEAIAAFFACPEGGRRILNAAPAIPDGTALFDRADMLIFNQSEFATYLKLDAEPESVAQLLVVRRLLSRPNQAAVVTLGARGAVAIWLDRVVESAPFPAEPVDTTGAGDCFCGTVAAAVALGIGPERALTLANAAAAITTMGRGAAVAMPDRKSVEAFVVAGGRG